MTVLILALAANPAWAAEFSLDGWQVNLDTTVAAGTLVRTSPKDRRFIGIANGGTFRTPNNDNGTLNFSTPSIVSAPFSINEELQVKRGDTGLFVRAAGFWNPIYDGIAPDFRKFPRATVRDLGFDLRLLDAFAFTTIPLGTSKIAIRVGNQVINWGESIFILGGINSATPFDANALERPGAELREAVLPIPAIDLRTNVSSNTSLEAFYEVYWTRTRFEPVGSFFSTNDSVSDGATYSVLDKSFPDNTSGLQKINLATNDPYGAVLLRSTDRHPPNQGEFGVALRTTAPFLNDAELGLYFETYHSRTPFVGYRTGTLAAALANERLLFTGRGSTYNSSASVYDDYPADIHLLGASFSTSIFAGIGLQGEISHRFNQPLILATPDAVLTLEAPYLCRLGADLAALGLGALGAPATAACGQARADPVTAAAGGLAGFGASFPQYRRFPVTQAQISATKQMSPVPAIDLAGWTLVGELGANVIGDYPHENGLFDSPNASDVSSSFAPLATLAGTLQKKGRVTQAATGGVFAALGDMPNLLPYGIDLQPFAALFYGIAGRDAIGAGDFQQGQAAISLGASFNYLQRIHVTAQYTNHFGIGPTTYDVLADRDYASLAFAYNF